ncbi:MAG: protein kinase family protein [Chlamydiae bacterium]|nr:protein kinase family protein [Chlamydiota bacterium]
MLPVFGPTNQEIPVICDPSLSSPIPQSVSTPMSGRATPLDTPEPMISMAVISILRQIIAVFNPDAPLLPERICRQEVTVTSKNQDCKLKTRELFIYDKILVRAGQSEVRGASWTGNKVHKPYLLLTPKKLADGLPNYSEAELRMHMRAQSLNIAPKLYPCMRVDGSFSSSRNSLIRFANQGDLILYFEKNRLEIKELIEISINMAIQVVNLHFLKIYHRDIKPENFLAHQDAEGRIHIFLSDYGLATTELKFTKRKGSHGYCPPEYSSFEKPYDGVAADQFGLGAALFGVLLQKPLDRLYEYSHKSRFTVQDKILDYEAFATQRDQEIGALIDRHMDPAKPFEPLKKALKGLLKTRASDRIAIGEVIHLLEETLASL